MVNTVSALREVKKVIKDGDVDNPEFYKELSEKLDKFTEHLFNKEDPKEWTGEISNIEKMLLEKLDREVYVQNFFEKHRLTFSSPDELEQQKEAVLEQVHNNLTLARTRLVNYNPILGRIRF